jgi:hypothetical protein
MLLLQIENINIKELYLNVQSKYGESMEKIVEKCMEN